jgi:hypothetical protein
MSLIVTRLNLVKRPPLVGFFSLEVTKWGIEINSISLFEKDGKYWFNLPSHEYTTKNGETKQAPYFRFKEKKHWVIFQNAVLSAVDAYLQSKVV